MFLGVVDWARGAVDGTLIQFATYNRFLGGSTLKHAFSDITVV
jgi:hypothetical protein